MSRYFDSKGTAGYQYELDNAEVLLTRARIDDGRIVLANGASYRMLVIPDGIDGMTPTLAAKLRTFVDQGMAIMGTRPTPPLTLAGQTDGDTEFHLSVPALWGAAAVAFLLRPCSLSGSMSPGPATANPH